jgi:hypothetical protein
MTRHAPDPSLLGGTYDTTETAGPGSRHTRIEGISVAFDVARAGDLAYALRSMDEEDTEVPPNLVQTSPGLTVNRGDPDGDRKRVTAAAARVRRELAEQGMEVDPVTGQVRAADHTAAWQNHAASVGPPVVVDDSTNWSAG